MAPFEALYGRRCRTLVLWDRASDEQVLGVDLLEYDTNQVELIKKRLLTT